MTAQPKKKHLQDKVSREMPKSCANDAPGFFDGLIADVTPYGFPGMMIATTRKHTDKNGQ